MLLCCSVAAWKTCTVSCATALACVTDCVGFHCKLVLGTLVFSHFQLACVTAFTFPFLSTQNCLVRCSSQRWLTDLDCPLHFRDSMLIDHQAILSGVLVCHRLQYRQTERVSQWHRLWRIGICLSPWLLKTTAAQPVYSGLRSGSLAAQKIKNQAFEAGIKRRDALWWLQRCVWCALRHPRLGWFVQPEPAQPSLARPQHCRPPASPG